MSLTELRMDAICEAMSDGVERTATEITDLLFAADNATYWDLFGHVSDPVSSVRDVCKVAAMRGRLRARPGKRAALFRIPDAASRTVSHSWAKPEGTP